MGRPAALSRELIVDAAANLVAEHGAEAMTARRLGEALGCDPSALYRHYANMDDLQREVGDRFLAAVHVAPRRGESWVAAVRRICVELRAVQLHPRVDPAARAAQALDGDIVTQARHDDLAAARLARGLHGEQIAVHDAGIAHAHAMYTQQVVWTRIKQAHIEAVASLDMLAGEHRLTSRNPANQWQARLLAIRIQQLNATRCTRDQADDPLSLQGAQVLLSGIDRTEPQFPGNLGTRRRHPGFSYK